MLLNNGEELILKEKNVTYLRSGRRGTLFLSNQRIYMERIEVEKKMLGLKEERTEHMIALIPLRTISGLTVEKNLLLKSHFLKVTTAKAVYEFKVENPDTWKERIIMAKKGGASQSQSAAKNAITINVVQQTPTQPIQKEVVERQVVKVRCRYCGTLIDEAIGKCPSCGAQL